MRDVALRTNDKRGVSLIAHPDPNGCARPCVHPQTLCPAFIAADLIIQSIQQVHRRMVVPKTGFLRAGNGPADSGHSRHDFLAWLASSRRAASATMASTIEAAAASTRSHSS